MPALLALSALPPAGCSRSQPARLPAWDAATWSAVEREVEDFRSGLGGAGVSVAVRLGDSLAFARGSGRLAATGEPVTPATRFAIGEVERQFTAAAALALEAAGRLSLDDPLPAELVTVQPGEPTPTLRDLLHQVSGLRADPAGGRALVGTLPRTFWTESRVHADVARALLARRSERGYAAELAALAERAGLTDFEARGPDSVWCTPAGLVRWSRALESGAVIAPKAHAQMISLRKLRDDRAWPYGMGLELQSFESSVKVMHAGTGAGATTVLASYPREGVGIAVMADRADAWAVTGLERRLARILFGHRTPTPPEKPLRPSDLERVAGEYACGGLGFAVDDSAGTVRLTVRSRERGPAWATLEVVPLRHLGEGRFVGARDPDAVHLWHKRGPGPAPEVVIGWFGLPCQALRVDASPAE